MFTQAPQRFTSQQQTVPTPATAVHPRARKTKAAVAASGVGKRPASPLASKEGALKYFEDREGEAAAVGAVVGAEDDGDEADASATQAEASEWVKPVRLKGLRRNAQKKPSIAALKRGGWAYK